MAALARVVPPAFGGDLVMHNGEEDDGDDANIGRHPPVCATQRRCPRVAENAPALPATKLSIPTHDDAAPPSPAAERRGTPPGAVPQPSTKLLPLDRRRFYASASKGPLAFFNMDSVARRAELQRLARTAEVARHLPYMAEAVQALSAQMALGGALDLLRELEVVTACAATRAAIREYCSLAQQEDAGCGEVGAALDAARREIARKVRRRKQKWRSQQARRQAADAAGRAQEQQQQQRQEERDQQQQMRRQEQQEQEQLQAAAAAATTWLRLTRVQDTGERRRAPEQVAQEVADEFDRLAAAHAATTAVPLPPLAAWGSAGALHQECDLCHGCVACAAEGGGCVTCICSAQP